MRIDLATAGALVGFVGSAASVQAAPSFSVEALSALGVPDVSVIDATPVPAAAGTAPAYCDVRGTIVTKGAGVAEGTRARCHATARGLETALPVSSSVGGNAGQSGAFGERHRPQHRAGKGLHDDPTGDFIGMPNRDTFNDDSSYYATILHELTHWSGAKHRLDRDLSGKFGNSKYAFEELVAELGAAFLCQDYQIQGELRHAGYIQNWLTCLRENNQAIFKAAALAQKAADYINSLDAITNQVAA